MGRFSTTRDVPDFNPGKNRPSPAPAKYAAGFVLTNHILAVDN